MYEMSSDEERDLTADAVLYIEKGCYPSNCTPNRKRAIRRKAGKFCLRKGEIYYEKKAGQVNPGFMIMTINAICLYSLLNILKMNLKDFESCVTAIQIQHLGTWVRRKHIIELKKDLHGKA